jgi:hypothetical protein
MPRGIGRDGLQHPYRDGGIKKGKDFGENFLPGQRTGRKNAVSGRQ